MKTMALKIGVCCCNFDIHDFSPVDQKSHCTPESNLQNFSQMTFQKKHLQHHLFSTNTKLKKIGKKWQLA